MISCAAENKRWSITPNGIGWIPAKMVHCAKSWGKVSAWSLHLPNNLCRHSRLVNITQAIWQDPSISKTQDQWASSIGMSVRSFSRYFIKETGITFSHWRQLAKLLVSLEKLSQGLPINEIACDVGFTDASAYIAAFKAVFRLLQGVILVNENIVNSIMACIL